MTGAAIPDPLLDPDEPDPAALDNEAGGSAFFLTCDHGGRAIPRRLGRLGLPEPETFRHIAWDIGVAAVGRLLSAQLDAALIVQAYSRLVIDCNRDPSVPSSIAEISEDTPIPGNRGLDRGRPHGADRGGLSPVSRPDRRGARPAAGPGPAHHAGGAAQLYPGVQRRLAAVACGRAL